MNDYISTYVSNKIRWKQSMRSTRNLIKYFISNLLVIGSKWKSVQRQWKSLDNEWKVCGKWIILKWVKTIRNWVKKSMWIRTKSIWKFTHEIQWFPSEIHCGSFSQCTTSVLHQLVQHACGWKQTWKNTRWARGRASNESEKAYQGNHDGKQENGGELWECTVSLWYEQRSVLQGWLGYLQLILGYDCKAKVSGSRYERYLQSSDMTVKHRLVCQE